MMSAVLAYMIEGIANTTMNEVISIDHAKSGMRLSVMPGARSLKIVVMRHTATTSADTSVNVMSCAQKSVRLPGDCSGPDNGVYANQPASGPELRKNAV